MLDFLLSTAKINSASASVTVAAGGTGSVTIPYTTITGKTAYLMRTYPSSTGLVLGNAYLSGGNAVINYRNDSEYELNATIYVQIIHI